MVFPNPMIYKEIFHVIKIKAQRVPLNWRNLDINSPVQWRRCALTRCRFNALGTLVKMTRLQVCLPGSISG